LPAGWAAGENTEIVPDAPFAARGVKADIKALVIEDNPGDARLVEEALTAEPCSAITVETCGRLDAGLARASMKQFDVLILDLSLPDSSGYETFRKARSELPDCPIVVLTGASDQDMALETVRGGAQDYLVKGQTHAAALARAVFHAVERHRTTQALREAANTDELTGLPNLRGFRLLATHQLSLAAREGWPITLLYMDVDDLKLVNDTFGHAAGSDLLARVADALRSVARRSDVLARVGGDEFCLLLCGKGPSDVAAVRARVRTAISALNRATITGPVSLSVGAVSFAACGEVELEQLMGEADRLMYADKRGHRLTRPADAQLPGGSPGRPSRPSWAAGSGSAPPL
jgi:two-component system cell cycle response regulator